MWAFGECHGRGAFTHTAYHDDETVAGRGEKRPRGASLKLLTLVAKNGLGAVA